MRCFLSFVLFLIGPSFVFGKAVVGHFNDEFIGEGGLFNLLSNSYIVNNLALMVVLFFCINFIETRKGILNRSLEIFFLTSLRHIQLKVVLNKCAII